jgi:hypothetical protein
MDARKKCEMKNRYLRYLQEGTEQNSLIATYFLIGFNVGSLIPEGKLVNLNVLLIAILHKFKHNFQD